MKGSGAVPKDFSAVIKLSAPSRGEDPAEGTRCSTGSSRAAWSHLTNNMVPRPAERGAAQEHSLLYLKLIILFKTLK